MTFTKSIKVYFSESIDFDRKIGKLDFWRVTEVLKNKYGEPIKPKD